MSHAFAMLCAVGAITLAPAALQGQAAGATPSTAGGAQKVAVCSLLPKDQVKRHLPWPDVLDQMPVDEEAVGTAGSSCNYPSVHVQVLPYNARSIESLRQRGGLEAVAGLGDEAYFYHNRNGYAELYVRVGQRLLTVQANADAGVAAVKPGALALAEALVARLR